MNYKVEVLPGEPIILATISKQFSVANDMARSDAEVRTALDKASEPMALVVDAREVSLGLDDVIQGTNRGSRGEQPILQHPNLKELLFVTPNALVKAAIRGLNSVTFGNVNARAFDTVEEALAHIRS